jgi:mRNA interferase RelE/StbE
MSVPEDGIRTLCVPDDVAVLIRGLHPEIKRKVRAALEEIVARPQCGKPLKEALFGLRSFRLGRLRIVYRLAEDRIIEIVALGPRRTIYAETYRKVSRSGD